MTRQERVRALLGNIKNWSWDIEPHFKLDKDDADALFEHLRDDPEMGGVYQSERRSDEDGSIHKE